MKIPDGKLIAETVKPVPEALKEYAHDFRGCISIRQGEKGMASEGFIIVEDGNVLASAFSMMGIMLYQMNALDRMMMLKSPTVKVYAYGEEEKAQVFSGYPDSVIGGLPYVPEANTGEVEAPAAPEPKRISYDVLLATVIRLPGVVAAALVVDGLPIYQQGQQVDFEHIAGATEDMVRSGARIAGELQLGSADQIILETPSNKVVIAPLNDMFLCVLTSADANLGLVRLSIRNAQNHMRE